MTIPKEKLPYICYCPCCCLSDDPEDSAEYPPWEGAEPTYNRRYDCSCKQRWTSEGFGYGLDLNQSLRTIAMRARDLGNKTVANLVEKTRDELRIYLDVLS